MCVCVCAWLCVCVCVCVCACVRACVRVRACLSASSQACAHTRTCEIDPAKVCPVDPAFPSHGGPAPSEAALRTSAETQSAVRPRHCTAYATATATPRAASGLALRASLGSSASSPARLIAARKRSEITSTGYVRDNGGLMRPSLGNAVLVWATAGLLLQRCSRDPQGVLKRHSRGTRGRQHRPQATWLLGAELHALKDQRDALLIRPL